MSIHRNRKDSKPNKKCRQVLSLGGSIMQNTYFLLHVFLRSPSFSPTPRTFTVEKTFKKIMKGKGK